MTRLADTSIHRQLGTTGPLDWNMLVAAVDAGVVEDERLDWKKGPYGTNGGAEFAKDVAAFANSGGGIIVIGVDEVRGVGAAKSIHPFDSNNESYDRQMRSWAMTAVQPPLPTLTFHPLLNDEGEGVLVVAVPASGQMPHMVGTEGKFGYPIRVGKQAPWLREHDIERSYRARFDRRTSDETVLRSLIDFTRDHLTFSTDPWLIAAVRPTTLRSPLLPKPTGTEFTAALNATLKLRGAMGPNQHVWQAVRSVDSAALNPRRGPRSWVASSRGNGDPSATARYAYVSIHDDGSFVLAVESATAQDGVAGKNCVQAGVVAGISTDIVALGTALNEHYNIDGDYVALVDVVPAIDGQAFAYLESERIGGWTGTPEQPYWSIDAKRFLPVDAVITVDPTVEGRRSQAESIANDTANRFGVERVTFGWSNPPANATTK